MSMILGLERGKVKLVPHQSSWKLAADEKISLIKTILGEKVINIQHIGSTAIFNIHAKPIIDLVVGINSEHIFNDIDFYSETLSKYDIVFRGCERGNSNQFLFVIGDFEKNIRTFHIHFVIWNSKEWNDYINFRDYLNAFPKKAMEYDKIKQDLAYKFADDRNLYTLGKSQIINKVLEEVISWKQM